MPFLATLGGKIGLGLGVLVMLIGMKLAYDTYRENIGEARAEARIAAELLQQHQEATGQYIVQNALKLRSVEYTIGEKDKAHAQLRATYQNVLRIANERPTPVIDIPVINEEPDEQTCAVRPALVAAVNDLGRVLNSTAASGDSATD